MISNFKSIGSIIARLYRDLGANTELNESDIIEWSADALNMIGAYHQYDEVSKCLDVCNHQVELPCGFHKLVDISYKNKPIAWATNTLSHNYECDGCKIPNCGTQETFYITDGYLRTSFESGKICIVYLGIIVDDDGFPMIPDDIYFDKAITSYCTYMLDRIHFRAGRITESVYRDSERDWLFYVNSARGAANMPNAAQMERLKNVWVRLIPKQNEYNKFFKNNSNQERRRTF